MPSSSSTGTARKHNGRRQHRHNHGSGSGSRLTEPSPPPNASHPSPNSPPHPYHNYNNTEPPGSAALLSDEQSQQSLPPPPPPSFYGGGLGDRAASTDSKISDISMDDFGTTLESVFEYSDDTSDDGAYFRQDPYGPPKSLLGRQSSSSGSGNIGDGNKKHTNHGVNRHDAARTRHNRGMSGESAFRVLRRMGSKSSKIVRFQSAGASDFSLGSYSSDGGGTSPNNNGLVPPQQQQQQTGGPPPPSVVSSFNEEPPHSPTKGRSLMAKVAYAFRSPSGIHERKHSSTHIKQNSHRHYHRPQSPTSPSTPSSVSSSAAAAAPAPHTPATNEKTKGHFRQSSGSTREYPSYAMLHLRDPQTPQTTRSTLAELRPSSPLLVKTGGRGRTENNHKSSSRRPPASSGSGRGVYTGMSSSTGSSGRDYGGMAKTTPISSKNPSHPLKSGGGGAAVVRSTKEKASLDVQNEHDEEDEDDEDNDFVHETAPLMMKNMTASSRPNEFVFKSRTMAARVAANFLLDYESSRPPTLPSDFAQITPRQLTLYSIHFSWMWRWFVNAAIVVLFVSHTQNRLITAVMHSCVIVVFAAEVQMTEMMYGTNAKHDRRHGDRRLVRPMVVFLFLLGLESWAWYLVATDVEPNKSSPPLFSSILKPLVFFYVSAKARDSLEALVRISSIVLRVLVIEFGLILTFAAVGCRMFGSKHDSFHNLLTSWLSLFELSTTVVNPSLWMPMYEEKPSQAIYFVIFIVTAVIYYHSLVLSVVFQTYIQAATEIHERSVSDREDAVRLAFLALMKDSQAEYVSTSSVKKCLQVVRPHYNSLKLKALVEIVDPSNQNIVDYPSFRVKIRQALNASIRTARMATSFAMAVELIAAVVAVSNAIYVLMVTSEWDADWFESAHVVLGSVITLLGLLELLVRFNPLRFQHFAPITRLNIFFDGSALVAALVSCIGIVQYADGFDPDKHTDYLLMGRACDMIRMMRFFPMFRDVVRRSSDVLPAMAGPLILLLSVIHEFVFAGMAIWSGAIDVEILMENQVLTPLYCLNNFNSYVEGLVTVFNLLIVNDWHAIAEVYLYAEWNSHPLIVYPFFVSAICIGVFIMLNVITAFFVESFVTKRHEPSATANVLGDEQPAGNHRGFQIRTGENTNVRRISHFSTRGSTEFSLDDEPSSASPEMDQSTVASTGSGEVFAFDIYEREGYDHIMATVAGLSDDEQVAFARSVCNYLEIFESLASGREKVGYMICCQQSTQRFGNRRFQNSASGFLTDDMLHQVVSDMHSEMLVLTIRKNAFEDRCLVRTFPHQTDPLIQLEITATLLRYQPAATLFVSRIRPVTTSTLASGLNGT